ncbi:MAG: holo-ACP synthase [Nitrospinota bacterium]
MNQDGGGALGIVGIGSDLLEVQRMAEVGKKYGDRIYRRLFTRAEIAYCESKGSPQEHYAARFAAKEAALKALGAGWARGVRWMDVEVVRTEKGPPTLLFSGAAKELAEALGVRRAHLSISHTRGLAMASVVLEGGPPRVDLPPGRSSTGN